LQQGRIERSACLLRREYLFFHVITIDFM
jgi:hypothetical protein